MLSTRCVARWSIVLIVLAASTSVLPTAANVAHDVPTASEIGVDAKTIHIATSADVDNVLAPGLFKGGVDGVAARSSTSTPPAGSAVASS